MPRVSEVGCEENCRVRVFHLLYVVAEAPPFHTPTTVMPRGKYLD